MKRMLALALLSTTILATGPAMADPLKIGILETLSGSQTSTGRLYATGIQYGLNQINAKGGFNGAQVQVIEYDSAGTSAGAAAKFKQAEVDGVHIIIQGSSSAIAGQITEDVRKHNLRNPGNEMMYINIGAEASDLTGEKCHFYHFRFTTTPSMRIDALAKAMKGAGELGEKVYSINQNYSFGQEVEAAIVNASSFGGYTVTEKVLHDVNKIQDFAPFAAKIKAANPNTVLTGNWGNDLLLMMKATGDAGMKIRFGTFFLDQPGNLANAGETALGHYLANNYDIAAGDPAFAEQYKAAMGHYPTFVEPPAVFATEALGQALGTVNFKGGAVNVTAIAKALEDVTYMSPAGPISVRKADHQTIRPVVVSKVVKNPKYPVDGTDLGFKTVGIVPGTETIYPVQASCNMVRPN